MGRGTPGTWTFPFLSTRTDTGIMIFSEEVWRLVNEAIRSLPDKTKEIFLLSRMENLTNREIAEQLDISIKTVEFHIGRALKVMRVALKDYLPLFFLLFVK